jgi:HSP20 family protein
VDVQETPEALAFTVEVPGLTKDEVKITLENQVLTISGERKRTEEKKGETWHRVERSYGRFARSFTLPGYVQADRATAKYEHGVLVVTVPKAATPKPHTIEIK